MSWRQVTFYLIGFAWLAINANAQSTSQSIDFSQPGYSKTQPESGFFVEIRGGYMVPYTQRIPGTSVEFEMIPIPGGSYLMGSNESQRHRVDELPQVQVRVEPFWMGKTEVTWAEYRLYMRLDRQFKKFKREEIRVVTDANRIDAVSAPSMLYDPTLTFDYGDGDKQACGTPTQFAAKQYTKFLSLTTAQFYRLPTEAEWEYACRAGTTTVYSFGNDKKQLGDYAWFYDNSDERRHEVARLKPNPWGLHDMHGNVSEWVLDQYHADQYQKLDAETVTVESAFAKPTKLYPRVVRGGGCDHEAEDCRSASRFFSKEEWKDEDPDLPQSPWWHTSWEANAVGFRVLRPLHAPNKRSAREAFWQADLPEIEDAVQSHIMNSGKGALGIVDPELIPTIKSLQKSKREK